MIYICVAFKEEAKPLLSQWKFKRDRSAPCKLYISDTIYLVVTQMGQKNASRALQALLNYLPPKKDDTFINFGICGAPQQYSIGQVLKCHKICYKDECLLLPSPSSSVLTTVDTPSDTEQKTAVDMEAFGLFKIALHVFDKCYCIKVVSDHFEPLHVDIKTVSPLLESGVTTIKEIIDENSHSYRE